MNRHSSLNKGVMLDWIRHCEEAGEPFPSVAAIMGRFGFDSPEQARTLLADLADAGKIRIKWEGNEPIITLKAERPAFKSAPRPARTVKKPERTGADVDRTVARIKEIISGQKRVEPQREPETVREPAPPVVVVTPVHVPSGKQINVKVSPEVAAAFEREIRPGESASAAARRIFEAALLDRPTAAPSELPLPGRLYIKADIVRAAIAADVPVLDFVATLMDVGMRFWREPVREAAE